MNSPLAEIVQSGAQVLCHLVRAAARSPQTRFLTPDDLSMQLGFIVYPAGGEVARHVHRPVVRQVNGTLEVLIVREGRCLLDLYDDSLELVTTRELEAGDLVLLTSGGHGLRMTEDTVLLEVKQGPYTGMDEKERF